MMSIVYVISRIIMMYGMYCVCSACGAYLEDKGVAPFKKK